MSDFQRDFFEPQYYAVELGGIMTGTILNIPNLHYSLDKNSHRAEQTTFMIHRYVAIEDFLNEMIEMGVAFPFDKSKYLMSGLMADIKQRFVEKDIKRLVKMVESALQQERYVFRERAVLFLMGGKSGIYYYEKSAGSTSIAYELGIKCYVGERP